MIMKGTANRQYLLLIGMIIVCVYYERHQYYQYYHLRGQIFILSKTFFSLLIDFILKCYVL